MFIILLARKRMSVFLFFLFIYLLFIYIFSFFLHSFRKSNETQKNYKKFYVTELIHNMREERRDRAAERLYILRRTELCIAEKIFFLFRQVQAAYIFFLFSVLLLRYTLPIHTYMHRKKRRKKTQKRNIFLCGQRQQASCTIFQPTIDKFRVVQTAKQRERK